MYSIFKYNYILYLEKNFTSKFTMSPTKKISVLPPVIKKIGLKNYVCFFVVNNNNNQISRPIGLICVDRHKKIKIYDFNNYDFCHEYDFYKAYYNLNSNNFWPNKNIETEEFLRICLQDLYKIFTNC